MKNLDELNRKVQQIAARTKEQAARLTDDKAYQIIAAMFGDETAARLRKKTFEQGIGYKASEISEDLLQAITDELGEDVAKRIVNMLSSDETDDDDTETVRDGDDGRNVDPKQKDFDPFWAFALKERKPELPAAVRYQQDSFWKAFLKPE